jgi:hypothetical protein
METPDEQIQRRLQDRTDAKAIMRRNLSDLREMALLSASTNPAWAGGLRKIEEMQREMDNL